MMFAEDSRENKGRGRRGGRGGHHSNRGQHQHHHHNRGRPPGLRGRDIGLFYARRQQDRANKESRSVIALEPQQIKSIRGLLKNFRGEESAFRSTTSAAAHTGHRHFMSDYQRHLTANAEGGGGLAASADGSWWTAKATKAESHEADLSAKLLDDFRQTQKKSSYQKMVKVRKNLPAYQKRTELIRLIRENQVVVISGETGCGKTTQVPQFILDDALEHGEGAKTRIVCTQPRRISAISVAERVADERGGPCGGAKASVGYQIRLESKLPRAQGAILYCTTGIILQWMRSNPNLEEISHIVLDEIHERDLQTDLLLTCLKDLIASDRRHGSPIKVILMSATLNANQFSKYFNSCPTINIPGFTFPVKEYYLEDVLEMTGFRMAAKKSAKPAAKWRKHTARGKAETQMSRDYEDFIEPFLRDIAKSGQYSKATIESLSSPESEELNLELTSSLVRHIHQHQNDGAILVFLPGWDDITKLHKLLTEEPGHRLDPNSTRIYPLHSLLPSIDQRAIFEKPPAGVRKIVIATNIAETSITIEDIVYVVDCGKIKMTNFDLEANLSTLQPEWVSMANARQRRGRAGRVRAGICFHLFTRAREMILDQYVLPEILRTRLEEVILHIKSLGLGLAKPFLAKVMDPPDTKAIDLSLDMLKNINALYPSVESLTPLGFHLSRLPMDPQTGKMILFGAMFSCLDPVLTVASSLSFKSPFVIPMGQEAEADKRRTKLAGSTRSDHLMLVNALRGWEEAVKDGEGRAFCWEYFLSEQTMKMLQNMKKQFAETLFAMKFINSKDVKAASSNRHSDNEALVRAVICAGLYPNVAKIRIRRNKHRGAFASLQTPTERRVAIHPKSVNTKQADYKYPWMVYHQKMKSSDTYVYDCSMVSPLALIFFGRQVVWGHNDANTSLAEEMIVVDNFVKFDCASGVGQLVEDLRLALDSLLEYKITHPSSTNWKPGSREGDLLNAVIELLTVELNDMPVDYDDDDSY